MVMKYLYQHRGHREIHMASVFLIIIINIGTLLAQDNCLQKYSTSLMSPYRLHPSIKLKVYFSRDQFKENELKALRKAFDNWQRALSQTNVNIKFIEDTNPIPADCDDCLIIKRDNSLKKGAYGIFTAKKYKDGYITAASIGIKSDVHKTSALRRILQHEIGHGLGLLDCRSCKSGTSVMQGVWTVSFFGLPINLWINRMSDLPSACDIELISYGYNLPPPTETPTEDLVIMDGDTVINEQGVNNKLSVKSPEVGAGRIFIEKETIESKPKSAEEKSLIDALIARETEIRNALKDYTFTRDILIQTIDKKGKVSGEYHRKSQMIFDDKGNRIEQIISFPKPTLKGIAIVKEDLDDFSGSQLLGLELSDLDRYYISYIGIENIGDVPYHAFKITPANLNHAKLMNQRVFFGTVWADTKTMQIVKLKGQTLPEGDFRFPVFETHRQVVENKYFFPVNSQTDDKLVFKHGTIHMRMWIKFYDYKRFKSEVRIIEER
jgi:hypothetical protein